MHFCSACQLALPHGHYCQDDETYCDRCWSCPDCARPVPNGGRCAECSAPQVELGRVLPEVVCFLAELGLRLSDPLCVQPVGRPAAAYVAHDLAQLWLAQSGLPQTQLTAGLPRWVQRRMLLQLGYTQLANRLLIDDNPFRGGGLHLCLQLEQKVGSDQLVGHLQGLTSEGLEVDARGQEPRRDPLQKAPLPYAPGLKARQRSQVARALRGQLDGIAG